ncbi:MAG TPA: PEPxxWA-CTERM sorting domain-containing protein [Croceibacterium sp.]|nr:PEPxxWA-CTERM sorting domain-containing protein [Croceibacterium sp.]
MNKIALRILAASLAVSASAAASAQVYNQPYDGSTNAYSSQNDTSGTYGNFATVYDNFTLGSATTITNLAFTGEYFDPPTVGSTTAFNINFYADNAGQPGSSLWSTTISGNGGESCNTSGTFPLCTYDVTTNFSANAGTQYWLSIVPDLAFPPQWGWAQGSGGDSISYQDFFGARSQLSNDLAFTLNGTPGVPEPATWAMMLLGFGFVGGAMRNSKRRQKLTVSYA